MTEANLRHSRPSHQSHNCTTVLSS